MGSMKMVFGDHHQCSSSPSENNNFIPLSPISFLERAALVHGDKTSIVYGSSLRFSWKETHRRCLNFAASLVRLGISRHDVVVAFAPNVPALYELHFAVPMAGGVLSALNFSLDDTVLAVVLRQLEPKVILVDYQFVHVVVKALDSLVTKTNTEGALATMPTLILIPECDPKLVHDHDHNNLPQGIHTLNYNDLVHDDYDHGHEFNIVRPNDERDSISVSYTSGSTGIPKGVVYSHRAVWLNSMAIIHSMEMRQSSVFLWTVDMFRCNGWCYTWAVAALGATNVCLRNVDVSAETIFDNIGRHGVTHFCGKPSILHTLASYFDNNKLIEPLSSRVEIVVAGSLPCRETLFRVTLMGFNVSHGYGMTEALGPAFIEPWQPNQPVAKYSNTLRTILGFDVKDSTTMASVPRDGKSMGEIMFKGNTLMSGYLGNPKATQEAYKDGWYRTGDIGVRHEDGSVEMKDRAEDIVVVCGGKYVSTLEVEAVLLRHPKVSEAAVVGRQDHDHADGDHHDENNQIPVAFVKLKVGCECDDHMSSVACSKEIIEFCGDNLPGYMVPRAVMFGDLPANSTGKVQKFVLRYKANAEMVISHSDI